MKVKLKKWKLLLLLIPVIIVAGFIRAHNDSTKSIDGTYYLVLKNRSAKRASLDKSSWIKISGNQVIVKDDSGENSYPYNAEKQQFTKDSVQFTCLYAEGNLEVVEHGNSTTITSYVGYESSMYSAYEEGRVELSD